MLGTAILAKSMVIGELSESGQIGKTEPGEVLTFDGNVDGKEQDGEHIKISDKVYDLKKATKAVLRMDGEELTFGADELSYAEEKVGEYFISGLSITIDGETVALAYCRQDGTYVICYDDENCVTRIEFAETIHPIAPKFIPGAVLPVVEIADYNAITEAERATLDNVATNDTPLVLKFVLDGINITCTLAKITAEGVVGYSARVLLFQAAYDVAIVNEGGWTMSVNSAE